MKCYQYLFTYCIYIWLYYKSYWCNNSFVFINDQFFFKLFFIIFDCIVRTFLIIEFTIFSSGIKFSKNLNGFLKINLIIIYKFTMVERYKWEHYIHFLVTIYSIHILCCYFILLSIIFNYPYTSWWNKPNLLSYFTKYKIINKDCSLNLFFNLNLFYLIFIIIFYCCRLIVSKNIVSIRLLWTLSFLLCLFLNLFFIII